MLNLAPQYFDVGNFQQFNPHLHIIATDGCFYGNGTFMVSPKPEAKDQLEYLFCACFKTKRGHKSCKPMITDRPFNVCRPNPDFLCGVRILDTPAHVFWLSGCGAGNCLLPIHKWPICRISVLREKFYPRNITYMPAAKFSRALISNKFADFWMDIV